MYTTLMIFHAVISILLIISVLLQFGKGAEAGLISGGSSDSVMSGGQKGNILSKITTALTVIFIGNCLYLAHYQSNRTGHSILDAETPTAVPLGTPETQDPAGTSDSSSQESSDPAPVTE
jgi:preprotein translocase subunit SecG